MIRILIVTVTLLASAPPAAAQDRIGVHVTPSQSNASVAAPITLHGTPISGAVEVYRLTTPAVTPDNEQEPTPGQSGSRGRIWRGALIGGVAGCSIGTYRSRRNNDDAHVFNCLWVAGVGAGIGAVWRSLQP